MNIFPSYIQIVNFRETYQDNTVRSDFDRGVPKIRPLMSRGLKNMTFTGIICDSDFESFKEWFYSDIRSGSDWFEFLDPSFNPAKKIRARFSSTEIDATPVNNSFDKWSIQFNLVAYA